MAKKRTLYRVLSGRGRCNTCRSELAREELNDTTFIQDARVIVDDLREQARSYRYPLVRAGDRELAQLNQGIAVLAGRQHFQALDRAGYIVARQLRGVFQRA